MHVRSPKTLTFLAAVLAATTFAAISDAGATAPWHRSGGLKPVPTGKAQAPQQRALYQEERFIRNLYQGFLKRTPSGDEVQFWAREMQRGAGPTEMVQSFMESDEYFVRQTFLGLLGREPDPNGKNTFFNALQNGQSRAEVIESVVWSEEFQRRLR
jgi:hypothetical protein